MYLFNVKALTHYPVLKPKLNFPKSNHLNPPFSDNVHVYPKLFIIFFGFSKESFPLGEKKYTVKKYFETETL